MSSTSHALAPSGSASSILAAAALTSTLGLVPTPASLLAQTGVLAGPRAAATARNASAAIEQTRKEERFGGEVGKTVLGCLPGNSALVFGSSLGLSSELSGSGEDIGKASARPGQGAAAGGEDFGKGGGARSDAESATPPTARSSGGLRIGAH